MLVALLSYCTYYLNYFILKLFIYNNFGNNNLIYLIMCVLSIDKLLFLCYDNSERRITMTTSIKELDLLTMEEKLYRINERLEDFHASNYDWQRVIEDKWMMLVHTGGSL